MTSSNALLALSCLFISQASIASVTKIKMGDVDVIQVDADTGRSALEVARVNIPADFREYKEWMSPITGCELGFSYHEEKDVCLNRNGDTSMVTVFLPVIFK